MEQATEAKDYSSPVDKSISFFRNSRDGWKTKAKAQQAEIAR